jgi:hypothetical protein
MQITVQIEFEQVGRIIRRPARVRAQGLGETQREKGSVPTIRNNMAPILRVGLESRTRLHPALYILGLADGEFPVNQSAAALIAGLPAAHIKKFEFIST